MKPTPLLLIFSSLLLVLPQVVAAPASLPEAEAALALVGQQHAPGEVQAQLDAVTQGYEDELRQRYEGGVLDLPTLYGELIQLWSLRLELERRASQPTEATRAKLRSFYEARLELSERRVRAGWATEAELAEARRSLAEFLASE